MRENMFRGLLKNEDACAFFDGWFYGDLIRRADGTIWIRQYQTSTELEVFPETVGQSTGMKDRNGNAIYEGDILKTYPIIASDKIGDSSFNCVVSFNGSSWIANGVLGENQCRIFEVVGNIFENKELIGKQYEKRF